MTACLALLFAIACHPSAVPNAPRLPTVNFDTDKPVTVTVEVADTPEGRARGLMFRKHLGEQRGMLFVFPDAEPRAFWMKNTYVPLDMIFIDAHKRVVGVVAGAEPLTEQARGVPVPSKYVVEVNAGFARAHDIDTGTPVVFNDLMTQPR